MPDGTEIDLTRQQFGGKEVPPGELRTREYVLSHPATVERYERLKAAAYA